MNEHKSSGFLDRALRNLRGAWDKIAGAHSEFSSSSLTADLSGDDPERLKVQMQACLDSVGGEVSARARAAALGQAYLVLNEDGRVKFLQILVREFGAEAEAVGDAMEAVRGASDPVAWRGAVRTLRQALDPPYDTLLTQFNGLPEGVKFLVDMRAEIRGWMSAHPDLRGLEADLRALLTSWFDVGFLELRQITWDAPAALLEKLIAYEAVHAIEGWDDLKHRLADDRRCFAFFHPRMPDEPLIFVWVALVQGMSTDIRDLLDQTTILQNPESADTAIFYSISNAQPGLSGISFGNFLIKRVVDSLRAELPSLKNFATLSPVPGFRRWAWQALDEGEIAFTEAEATRLVAAADSGGDAVAALKQLMARTGWDTDQTAVDAVRQPLMRLCAHYLLNEKRPEGTARDAVAHFHLNNGAQVAQLNWLADCSAKGMDQSAGIMVNYRYMLDRIESNHELYHGQQKVRASSAVRSLLKS